MGIGVAEPEPITLFLVAELSEENINNVSHLLVTLNLCPLLSESFLCGFNKCTSYAPSPLGSEPLMPFFFLRPQFMIFFSQSQLMTIFPI